MNPPKKEKKVEKMQEEFSSVDSKPAKNSSLMPFDEMKKFADNFFQAEDSNLPRTNTEEKKDLKIDHKFGEPNQPHIPQRVLPLYKIQTQDLKNKKLDFEDLYQIFLEEG